MAVNVPTITDAKVIAKRTGAAGVIIIAFGPKAYPLKTCGSSYGSTKKLCVHFGKAMKKIMEDYWNWKPKPPIDVGDVYDS